MTDPLDTLAEAERLGTRLIEAVHEARVVMKDLRAAIHDADQVTADLRSAAQKTLDEGIGEQVKQGLEEYTETIRDAMDSAVARVNHQFDHLADILMGTDKVTKAKGLPSLTEIAEVRRQLNTHPTTMPPA